MLWREAEGEQRWLPGPWQSGSREGTPVGREGAARACGADWAPAGFSKSSGEREDGAHKTSPQERVQQAPAPQVAALRLV